jgi:hypothetical protein
MVFIMDDLFWNRMGAPDLAMLLHYSWRDRWEMRLSGCYSGFVCFSVSVDLGNERCVYFMSRLVSSTSRGCFCWFGSLSFCLSVFSFSVSGLWLDAFVNSFGIEICSSCCCSVWYCDSDNRNLRCSFVFSNTFYCFFGEIVTI